MSPPIRGAGTAARLRGALAGGALSIVATDHAVFNSTQKRLGRHDFRCPTAATLPWHHMACAYLEGMLDFSMVSRVPTPSGGAVLQLQEDTERRQRYRGAPACSMAGDGGSG
jgi:hypothetical protein